MNIVNIGYDSTNYYLLEPDKVGFLVDTGWPGTMPKLINVCKRKRVPFKKIHYLLVTHFHPDHAGLAQELKNLGVRLIVMANQRSAIPLLGKYMKRGSKYHKISLEGNIDLEPGESRPFLASIGIPGEIIETPGHSTDSVTLILDVGIAFTGDLNPPMAATDENRALIEASWARIRSYGVVIIHPGHGPSGFI